MGLNDSVDMDETLEHRTTKRPGDAVKSASRSPRWGWIVIAISSLVYLIGIASPPHLMDDVDAVQAQIARNMLGSGDWVTARLDGVPYLEKAPLIYWMMAASYKVFGIHDWAARLPIALAVVFLCWVTYRFALWGFGPEAGLYAGIAISTSIGLFLFTRILIPDAILTLAITGAIWAWLCLLEPEAEAEPSRPWRLPLLLGGCLGAGLLLKGLIAVVFPVLAGLAYMAFTRQIFSLAAWRRLHLPTAIAVTLAVAAPWHLLAMQRNPPYFAFSMHSGPGEYRGFFWFYFFNEHFLRFLNLRYPRDYNTVPRLLFWLLNLVWLFPWSAYLPAAWGLSYSPATRAGRVRSMAACWIGTVMLFFTFSTTQEYYSMPIYPALALLAGSALTAGGRSLRLGTLALLSVSALLFVALSGVLLMVWRLPVQGDIAMALTQHPELYTLSMGHIRDLTLNSFAYLKLPLALAALAFGSCALALLAARRNIRRTVFALAFSMILFLHAARIALIRFDSYLGSYPLTESLRRSPSGQLIEANSYYAFSSVFFYADRTALLWNGRNDNLEYGSYAPGAPQVFINDAQLASRWAEAERYYLLAYGAEMPHLEQLVGRSSLYVIAENGGNYLLSNHSLPK